MMGGKEPNLKAVHMTFAKVRTTLTKPLSAAILAGLILLAGIASAVHFLLDWQVHRSITQNAEVKAMKWSEHFFRTIPNAEKMFNTDTVVPEDLARLADSFAMIDTIHFELFDAEGHRTFLSTDGRVEENTSFSQTALETFQTGVPQFFLHHDDTEEENKQHEAIIESYVPAVTPDGRLLGTIEVYVDVGPLNDALEDAFQQISWVLIIGTTVLLAIPASAYVYRTNQLRKKDQRLLDLTRYDQLTGVFNRNSISEILKEKFATPASSAGLGVLFVDVDFFKQVNDQFGHVCGDRLLKHIARILQASTRDKDDIVGRFGGDEFVVIASNISQENFRKLYGRVMEGAKAPCVYEDKSYVPSLSVGAYLTTDQDTEKTAIHRADLAVYAAKRRGRGQVVEYTTDLEDLFAQDDGRQSA